MNKSPDPFFSVIIPAYNRAELLRRAIKSVLSQTFENYEIIVIDDCSPEKIGTVMGEFTDAPITYIRLEHNTGGGGARNAGIEISKGKYIAFLDSDDFWHPKKLDLTKKFIEDNNEPNCIICGLNILKTNNTQIQSIPQAKSIKILDDILIHGSIIQTSALTLKRKITHEIKFSENLKKHQDLDLYVKLDSKGIEAKYLMQPLCTWDISHEQTSISRSSATNISADWLKTICHQISAKAYRKFASRYILARAPSIKDATALYFDLTHQCNAYEKTLIGIESFFWTIVASSRRLVK